MGEGWDSDQAVLQNLVDAGCGEALIEQFFALEVHGKTSEQTGLLRIHRKLLLDKFHKYGQQLDCIDYLLSKLHKERSVKDTP